MAIPLVDVEADLTTNGKGGNLPSTIVEEVVDNDGEPLEGAALKATEAASASAALLHEVVILVGLKMEEEETAEMETEEQEPSSSTAVLESVEDVDADAEPLVVDVIEAAAEVAVEFVCEKCIRTDLGLEQKERWSVAGAAAVAMLLLALLPLHALPLLPVVDPKLPLVSIPAEREPL